MRKEIIPNIFKIGAELGITEIQVESVIIKSLSKTNFINYLAEIAETSPNNIKKAVAESQLGEKAISESIDLMSQKLQKASYNEIRNTIESTIIPQIFINLLSLESGKDADFIESLFTKYKTYEKGLLKKVLDSPAEPQKSLFIHKSKNNYKPYSSDLNFTNNKIQFIGFGAPAFKTYTDKITAADNWISYMENELRKNPNAMFQDGIIDYYNLFMKGPMPKNESALLSDEIKNKYGLYSAAIIDNFIIERFGSEEDRKQPKTKTKEIAKKLRNKIKYVISFGIGGNEMRWHVLAELHNNNPKSKNRWIPINFAADINLIPEDAVADNTVQIAYSRSGDTEETKGALEVFGKRFPNTIVYANKGELKTLGEKLGALVLPFPPKIAGRYCGLKTPVNLAPMYILGMDTLKYWKISEKISKNLVPKSKNNPAWEIAKFIFKHKILTGVKMIYLGQNHPLLKKSLDEASQFIMEGLAKEGNELFATVGMQYPRNSHYEIEGPLGNPNFWLYWNVIYTGVRTGEENKNLQYSNSIVKEKKELYADEIGLTLIAGNLNTFARRSPSVAILIPELDIETFAVLSKIYEDTIYYLCRLCMVDPFGNPAVKNVRTDSAMNVEKLYELKKKKIKNIDFLYNMIKENFS